MSIKITDETGSNADRHKEEKEDFQLVSVFFCVYIT